MAGITYDTGALIAAERNDRRMRALHASFLAEKVIPVVPAPVLAEAWRGGPRQASPARLMAMCDVEEMTEEQAHAVGVLAGRSGRDDIVDVAVVEGAIRRGDAIATSNCDHIELVAGAVRRRVIIEDVRSVARRPAVGLSIDDIGRTSGYWHEGMSRAGSRSSRTSRS